MQIQSRVLFYYALWFRVPGATPAKMKALQRKCIYPVKSEDLSGRETGYPILPSLIKHFPLPGAMRIYYIQLKPHAQKNTREFTEGHQTMQTAFKTRRISDGTAPAVHKYYNVSPESPDGKHALFFCFDEAIPGPGRIMLRNLETDELRVLGRVPAARGHSGAFQTWLDDNQVAWLHREEQQSSIIIHDITTGDEKKLEGAFKDYNRKTATAVSDDHIRVFDGCPTDKEGIWLVDMESGEWRQAVTREQAADLLPPIEGLRIEEFSFKGADFSPDGESLLVKLSNVGPWREHQGAKGPLVKAVFLADGDGGNLRYFGPCCEHTTWPADGEGIMGYEKIGPFYPGEQPLKRLVCAVHPVDGGPTRILHEGPGCHATLHPAKPLVLTDAFCFPTDDEIGVLLYDAPSAQPRIPARFKMGDTHWASGVHAHPAWSGDGSRIYFNARDERCVPQVYQVELDAVL